MVRRKRASEDGLPLPRNLFPDMVKADPEAWRDARFEWSRNGHNWGPKKLGLLAFYDETVYLYRSALGVSIPLGSRERYERKLDEG